MYGNVVHCSLKNITSHSKGQKTVGRACASLILANNMMPLNEAYIANSFSDVL